MLVDFSNLKDEELVVIIQNEQADNRDEGIKELFSRHEPLCHDVLNRYKSALDSTGSMPSDITDDNIYVVYDSAMKYDPSKGSKFSTWLANQVRYKCLNEINKNKKNVSEDDSCLDYFQHLNKENFNFSESADQIFDYIGQMKDKRVKKIFELRYFSSDKNRPWREIADEIGCSIQCAINVHNKAAKVIKNKLESTKDIDII